MQKQLQHKDFMQNNLNKPLASKILTKPRTLISIETVYGMILKLYVWRDD